MKDTTYIVAFIKFGSKRDMIDLIENGTIFMNSIQNFKLIEDDYLRGDSYEGINQIWNFPSGEFEIPTLNYKGNYISMQLRSSYENTFGNIYSLYCISSHGFHAPTDFIIDKKV